MTARYWASLHNAWEQRRHTALLVAIVCALSVRPLAGDAGIGPAVFSVAMLVLLLVALITVRVDDLVGEQTAIFAARRRRNTMLWPLALLAMAERVYMIASHNPRTLLLGMFTWTLLVGYVTASQLRSLLRQKDVTGETLSMSVSIYLLLGLSWGLVYALIFELVPGSFRFDESIGEISAINEAHILPILVYFSLTTLSTVGFGDIAPVSQLARHLAVTEAIVGQFYLAILVARLVAIQMSRR